jgi:pyruvate formate lyase activating enzyme
MTEIKGFLETSFVDWPGKLCAVVFFSHCNFRCPYCHNHTLVCHPERYPSISIEEILRRLRPLRDWVDGVCITGGEPTLHTRLPVLIRQIKRNGFSVKLDTNGSNPRMVENLIETGAIDFVSMDVKAPLDSFRYRRSAGSSIDLDPILKTIEFLKRGKMEYQFRMTVVPHLHTREDVETLGDQLKAGHRLTLQNFNPEDPLDPSLHDTLPYDTEILKEMERKVQGMIS